MGIFNVTLGSINHTTGGNTQGYQNYSCTQQTPLARGLTYPVSIRTNANVDENVRVWIDYNNDGQFNTTTELFFSSDNARLHTGTSLLIPATAVAGIPLRLRVAADAATAPLPTPCSTPQFSQTEDYAVVLGTNSQPPVAAFSATSASACTGTFAFTDRSSRGPSSWRWDFGDGTTSILPSPAHTYGAAGSYRVQLRACNANGCDSVAVNGAVSWYPPLGVAAACAPAAAAPCCGYGITRFSLAGQTHASADGRAGYEDFSCVRRLTVQQGQLCPVQVTTGNTLPHQVRVYIDYNNNGSFAEPEELVLESLAAVSPSALVGIAGGGVTGTPLRLRVVADIVGPPVTSCSVPTLGQVEDYSLVITPPPCTGLPAALPRIAAPQVCVGFPATLYYSAASVAGASLQWQSSADSLTWANVPRATTPALTTPPITATPLYYRVRAVCGAATRFSPAFRPAPVPALCYCRPAISNISTCGDLSRLGRVWLPNTALDVPPAGCDTQPDEVGRILSLYPASQTATLQRGGVYQLHAVVPARGLVGGWVDYNHNGVFEASEYLAFAYSGAGSTLARATFAVPAAAVLGLTGLRLRLGIDTYSAFAAGFSCQPEGNGETLDVLVTIGPPDCAAFPLAGGRVQGPRTYCPGAVPPVAVLDHTNNAALQWQTSPDSLAWTNVPGATAAQLGGPAAAYQDSLYVRVRVQCTGRTAYSPAVYLRPDPQLCFCTISAGFQQQPTEELASVRMANTPLFSRFSPAANASPYRFYPPTAPANTATLLAGVSYPVVLVGTNLSRYLIYASSWLDADNSGRFTPAEGTVLKTMGGTPADTVATLTVPRTATPARQARLRTQTLGQWEDFDHDRQCAQFRTDMRDFLVGLAPAAPSALPLTAGLIQGLSSTGVVSSCPGQRVRLTVVGYSRGAALQWQQQVAGGSWQPVANATDEAFVSGILAGPTSFRVEVRLGAAGPAVSPAVLVSPTAPCPCQANLGSAVMFNGAATIRGFGLLSQYARLRNRNNTVPPVVNGSMYTDYSLGNDSLHLYLYRGQLYRYYIDARENITMPSNVALWADYNRNGVFEASEYLGGQNFGGSFTVPAGTPLGPVRVRIRSRFRQTMGIGAGEACTASLSPSETEDYTFTVANPPAFTAPVIAATGALAVGGTVQLSTREPLPAGTVLTWEGPGGFVSTQTQPTLTNLTAARSGDYYLTARTAAGDFQLTMARRLQIGQGLATAPGRPATAGGFVLYPNPSTGSVSVRLEPNAPAYEMLRVLSSTGQLLYIRPLTARDRGTDLPLDLRAQPRGLYLVQLMGPTGIISRKLLLE